MNKMLFFNKSFLTSFCHITTEEILTCYRFAIVNEFPASYISKSDEYANFIQQFLNQNVLLGTRSQIYLIHNSFHNIIFLLSQSSLILSELTL